MIVFLLCAQLAATDSIYSTASVKALVASASQANRVVPDSLLSYRARVESEVSLVLQPSEGPEVSGQVEQLENLVTWLRTGEYEQRVIGYRVRSVGITMSSLSYARGAWTVPVLYGNRLSLFFGSRDTIADPIRRRNRTPRRDSSVIAIHPLASNRERIYRFSGGDTVTLIRLKNRSVAVRRILATPIAEATRPITVFHGEIDIDADRFHIVRMRGRFLTVGERTTVRGQILRGAITPVAYVELVNAEVAEQFWLPTYQRIEAQIASPMTGDAKSIFRVISRFRDYDLNGIPVNVEVGSPADSLRLAPHRLTIAPMDSLQQYSSWSTELGESGREVRATDFDDLAPEQWRPTGRPRFELRASRFSEVFRFNRIEGVYTGLAGVVRFRDAFPGLVMRGNGGYAWSEGTLKGGASAELRRGKVLMIGSAARQLAHTNDFPPAVDAGATFAALLASLDNYDYVDRRVALASARLAVGDLKRPRAVLSISAGAATDRAEVRRVDSGPLGDPYSFRHNRAVLEGSYWYSAAAMDVHPEVTGESITPGVGASIFYQRGDGQLDWQRLEARVTARRNGRIITYAARADAGMLLGNGVIPPQQLYELGGSTGLPGYDYKEFAGDRAVLVRSVAMAGLPVLRAPIRLSRRWFLPAPSPAFAVGLQAGWTGASDQRAAQAIALLGPMRNARTGAPIVTGSGEQFPLSRPTLRTRSSVDVGLRFFGGSVGIAMARPLDHRDNWRLQISGSAW